MIVLPEITLRDLMAHIVSAAHQLSDEIGDPHPLSTITETQLRQAAIVALQIATGEAIWPGDRPIRLRRQKRSYGIFQED